MTDYPNLRAFLEVEPETRRCQTACKPDEYCSCRLNRSRLSGIVPKIAPEIMALMEDHARLLRTLEANGATIEQWRTVVDAI
jgi:hypothetical protein